MDFHENSWKFNESSIHWNYKDDLRGWRKIDGNVEKKEATSEIHWVFIWLKNKKRRFFLLQSIGIIRTICENGEKLMEMWRKRKPHPKFIRFLFGLQAKTNKTANVDVKNEKSGSNLPGGMGLIRETRDFEEQKAKLDNFLNFMNFMDLMQNMGVWCSL